MSALGYRLVLTRLAVLLALVASFPSCKSGLKATISRASGAKTNQPTVALKTPLPNPIPEGNYEIELTGSGAITSLTVGVISGASCPATLSGTDGLLISTYQVQFVANASKQSICAIVKNSADSDPAIINLGTFDVEDRSLIKFLYNDSETLDLGWLPQSTESQRVINIKFLDKGAATGLTIDSEQKRFSFYGGSYPGSGGTCKSTITEDCSVVISYEPSSVKMETLSVPWTYNIGTFTKSTSTSIKLRSYGIIGQADLHFPLNRSTSTATANMPEFGPDGSLHVPSCSDKEIKIFASGFSSGGRASALLGRSAESGGLIPSTERGGMSCPAQGLIVGSKYFVSDFSSHRILVWNSVPTRTGQLPDFILGQSSWSDNQANSGGSPSASTMNLPYGIGSDGTRFAVADYGNHRVLIWNSIPSQPNQPADVVIGQTTFTNVTANAGGLSNATLSAPASVTFSEGRMLVADYSNNRVLIWNTTPTSSGEAASVIVGQPNSTTSSAATTNAKLSGPFFGAVYGGKLFVSDHVNHRLLVWNSVPTTNGATASFVLGQPDFTSGTANRGQAVPSANGFKGPVGLASDGTRLSLGEYGNGRVLIWNSIPSSSAALPDIVLGRRSFTDASFISPELPTSVQLSPVGLATDGTKLLATDYDHNRVLVWNNAPTNNNAEPDVVLGQTDMSGYKANSGGISASTLNLPYSVAVHQGNIYVADFSNSRILGWSVNGLSNGASASYVYGQPDFTSSAANNGGISATSLAYPVSLQFEGGKMVVTDYGNNRVLLWNTPPPAASTPADIVFGQLAANTSAANQGLGAPNASTVSAPYASFYRDGKFLIADGLNNRILGFTSMLSSTGQAADFVLGQSSFVTSVQNQNGLSAQSLSLPVNINYLDNKWFVVSDYNNHRLIGLSLDSSGNVLERKVYGQKGLDQATSGTKVGEFSNYIYTVVKVQDKYYLAEYGNKRILILPTLFD